MIGEDYQYPLEQQALNYQGMHSNIFQTLASTIELLGEELFRVKISTTSTKISAHDSRFNTKLECTIRGLERLSSLNICNLQSATDVLSKVLDKTNSKVPHKKVDPSRNSGRRNSDGFSQKLFTIGKGARMRQESPRRSNNQKSLSSSFAEKSDSVYKSYCDIPSTPKTKIAPRKISNLRKSGIKPPTKTSTSRNMKGPKPHRNSEKKCLKKKLPLSKGVINKGNIISFTPSKLDLRIRDLDGQVASITRGSTQEYSDA
ncbi:unnamed protein product [Moneuplotes crassus]|uniref:Uncharacterized protein n=1 Tax=Euplotes crassus TaxID=5936 RepID=A0AAD1XID3_EUPCR|nr:unnamed protein product [Moneuplotes crassus]